MNQLQVVALHHAVPVDGVEQNFARTKLLRPVRRVLGRLPGGNRTVLGETAVAFEKILFHVQRNRHALRAETLGNAGNQLRIFKKGRVENDFFKPDVKQPGRVLQGGNAAAVGQGHESLFRHVLQQVKIRPPAFLRRGNVLNA